MPAPVSIRRERADHADVAPLLAALDQYLGSLYAPEANHILDVRGLSAPEVHFLVATQGERFVGCGAVRRMPAEPETGQQPYGEIKRMFVDPAARGLRIGSAMLAALEAQLRDAGVRLALLETGADQREAVRLYERSGYCRRAAFGGYPDNGLSVFYEKQLDVAAAP